MVDANDKQTCVIEKKKFFRCAIDFFGCVFRICFNNSVGDQYNLQKLANFRA
jgi:hypothetical protein